MRKVTAKITLIKCLSETKGEFRFTQNKPVIVEDPKIVSACEIDSDFAVQILSDEEVSTSSKDKKADKKTTKKVSKKEAASKKEAVSEEKKEAKEDVVEPDWDAIVTGKE